MFNPCRTEFIWANMVSFSIISQHWTGAHSEHSSSWKTQTRLSYAVNTSPGRQQPEDWLFPLKWRHNGRDSVSNHRPHDCLLKRLFRRRSKKTSKPRVTGLCAGIHRGPVNSLHKWPVTRKMFSFDDVIMIRNTPVAAPDAILLLSTSFDMSEQICNYICYTRIS